MHACRVMAWILISSMRKENKDDEKSWTACEKVLTLSDFDLSILILSHDGMKYTSSHFVVSGVLEGTITVQDD